jgi:Fibronectin type III-like domain
MRLHRFKQRSHPPRRTAASSYGWVRMPLAPGESNRAVVAVDRGLLSIFDLKSDTWKLVPGSYQVLVGGSSRDLGLQQSILLSNSVKRSLVSAGSEAAACTSLLPPT